MLDKNAIRDIILYDFRGHTTAKALSDHLMKLYPNESYTDIQLSIQRSWDDGTVKIDSNWSLYVDIDHQP